VGLVRHRTDPTILAGYSGYISSISSQEKNLKSNRTLSTLMLAAATVLGGCAANSPQQDTNTYPTPVRSSISSYGAIESIHATSSASNNTGTGVVVGGLVGGLLGNQVGSGSGKAAATVAGVVGGAMIGNSLEKNKKTQPEMHEIRVRLDNGNSTIVMQENIYELNVGNRVRVADGRVYRY
jgi:outer membrane lipoprotein SlyB